MEKITVYSQPDCPTCTVVKGFLQENKIEYDEKGIKKDNRARDELINKYKSYSTPTVVIGEEIVAGFDLEKLKSLLKL
ncbi:YruB family glutaredoxin-like protein [Bacillus methanolicus PB1]|uniref:YruB family glutaredoxin-like protein n=1 Tax=Bacillus methanolicus PB1 TaxID=997296 RepID=I3E5A9_BACMT|nr:glutaredoxin domain-containing protein [Bacillus methanolicus]EIJ81680.1 YruB family glutaredoxin-like protein [Bacillus methanolicus PB1]